MKTDHIQLVDCHVHIVEYMRGFGVRGEMRALHSGKVRWANGETNTLLPEGYGDTGFTPESLISIMDRHGIKKAVMLQGSLFGYQNEYTFESQEKYPGRLFGAGTFDPYCAQADKIMKRLVRDFKFRALKFEMSSFYGFMGYHPDFRLGGKLMKPVLDYASDNGVVISLDMGTMGDSSMQISELKKAAKKYRSTKFVLEHIFAPPANRDDDFIGHLQLLEDLGNVYFTLASLPFNTLPEPYPFASACRYLKIANEKVGAGRLMWGSDIPSVAASHPYDQLLGFVAEAGVFSENELRQIYAQTAEKVYSI